MAPPAPEPRRGYFPIKAFGVETQAPRWAIWALAGILVVGAGYAVYRKVYEEPEQVLVNLAAANKQLAAEVEEYSLHAMENPEKHELFEESDGRLILRVFKDHCVLIQRQTARGTRTKLVVDLARGQQAMSDQPIPTRLARLERFSDAMATLVSEPIVEAAQACNRGCLNPHPGQFKWWYGERRGPWVEVWRQWPEGCTHVQLFNVDSRTWDSNPDGTAKVRWTCCVH